MKTRTGKSVLEDAIESIQGAQKKVSNVKELAGSVLLARSLTDSNADPSTYPERRADVMHGAGVAQVCLERLQEVEQMLTRLKT